MYWVGLLLCVVLGVEAGGIVAGILADDTGWSVTLIVVGANLAPWTGIAAFALLLAGRRRRLAAAAGAVEPPQWETVMARIESVRAVGDGPDVPLRLDLTVAPEDRPGCRVDATAVVNLMDLDDFRVGRTVVVDQDRAHPWEVRVHPRPPAAFAGQVALARIDSAPSETRLSAPARSLPAAHGWGGVRAGVLAALAGAVLSVLPFHGFF
ncbi:hypothetical protein [Streptacidiphilus neutrinimicus]|uniref:hypothetical protein n=1 Tax=Streptacidiphilus neutrinimicus TaxID=105420 RepID=UPI000694CA0E|nr:hypothetical protein [Streptacidiphilus neutrinimicus]